MGQFGYGDASVERPISPVSATGQRLVVGVPGHGHRRPVLADSVLALNPAVRQSDAAHERLQDQEVARLRYRDVGLDLQSQQLAVARRRDAPLHAPFVTLRNQRVALPIAKRHVTSR